MEDNNSASQHINLKVKGRDDSVVHFKIKKKTPFRKLLVAYCNREDIPREAVRFCFEGNPIKDEDTPAVLELEDGDSIDVRQQHTGLTRRKTECPVCHDDFTNPKLLPCNHLACRDCVLSWLQKEGGQGGCPLCRAPILFSTQQGQGQLATMVDSLPTDRVTAALVESQRVIKGPHICAMCQSNVAATSYCFACSIKLCKTCTRYHQKLPVSKDHSLEQISKLTAERLAANRKATCNNHSDRPAELYCSAHQELICMMCYHTDHSSCPEVKAITDAARKKRTELTQQSQRLKEKGEEFAKQIKTAQDRFEDMHRKANDAFDNIQESVEKRRQEVHDLIQTDEDETMTALSAVKKISAAMTSQSGNIDHLVKSAPDDAFLQTLEQLKSRLDDLETESGTTAEVKYDGDIGLDSKQLTRLKSNLAKLGTIQKKQKQTSTSTKASSATATPSSARRAALEITLHVGDRVMPGLDWVHGNENGGGPGTVTAVPTRRGKTPGWVDVQWDNGGGGGLEWTYRNGAAGRFELELA
ncbi:uncharacterized protein [Littorina saxatilis]|uniref:Uncharacterized protein n=1 Tax=Littorina saxatilis TaxID=31220 RepID=A0AAN9AJL6_9CAEN